MYNMSIETALDETVRYLDKPFWKATEFIWDQSKVSKVAGVFMMVIALPLTTISRSLHWITQCYLQRSYSAYQSAAPEKKESAKKFLTFNVCMFPGILPVLFGGVRPAAQRMDALADFLKTQDADVLCLQEVDFDPAVQLIQKIQDHYRYFYYRIGPHPFGMGSALFWASKVPLKSEPRFIPFNIAGMQGGIRRGFFVAELEDRYVITTHLDPDPGPLPGRVRRDQIQAIVNHCNGLQKPVVLLGDLNIEAADHEALALLESHFANFDRNAEVTCLDNVSEVVKNPGTPPKYTAVDYILLTVEKVKQIVVKALEPHDHASMSDHSAVILIL
jgi:endonuclease/exonuclease/phosphatase family metal-dependent hydrolase